MAWKSFDNAEDSYDVVIIGAGISGINFAYRLQERHPNLSYCILEGRHEIGGTWSLFKYPGIRSDSDLHTFGFQWAAWKEKTSIAQGGLIQKYVTESAQMYGIDKNIKFLHTVNAASYDSKSHTWTFDVSGYGKPKTLRSHFMMLGTGYYNYHQPLESTIPGIDTFKGTVIHPQFWPKDLDYKDKEVVVIGSGATAVTVLPSMVKTGVKHITMLQRSPGYIVSVDNEDGTERVFRFFFSRFPSLLSIFLRTKWILTSFFIVRLSALAPSLIKAVLLRRVKKVIPKTTPMDPHFTPKYNVWDQRLCLVPDGDFFESLRSGKASVETGIIKTVTPNSIQLTSGAELHPDIIITATGLKLQFGGGIKMTVDGKLWDPAQKFIWRGVMLQNLPNAAFTIGYVDASWTLGADATAKLVCRLFSDMQKQGVAEVVPRLNEREKETMKAKGLLRLTSTYVKKAAATQPTAGDQGPWMPRSHYMRDLFNATYGDIHTGLDWVKDP